MSEKKDIDRLFQERFKDFEAAPPEYVWENIHDALQKKKKRRVIPLWWRTGGIAAALIIGLFFIWPYLGNVNNGATPVVLENKEPKPGDKLQPPATILNESHISDGDAQNTNSNNAVVSNEDLQPGANTSDELHNGDRAGSVKPPFRVKRKTKNSNVSTEDSYAYQKQGNTGNKNGNTIEKNQENPETFITAQQRTYANSTKKYSDHKSDGNLPQQSKEPNTVIDNGIANTNAADADFKNQTDAQNRVKTQSPVIDTNVPVLQNNIAETTVDTTKIKPENELEKLLREQQENKDKEEQVAEASDAKWSVKPQVAPVFYNSMGQGSPIDAQFAGNSKSYDKDLSYGVGINYAITERLKIRSGINTLNLSYSTQDVEFYASLTGGTNNIAPQARSANIVVQDKGKSPVITPTNAFSSQLNSSSAYSGAMIQQTGYVEVPVEMSYAVLDNKFGIEFIGGVSTLFLNNNNVSVVSTQGLSTTVGEAQNLNNIHFSTNVGLGFKYKFFKSFEANFEPMFKYQVNTYSRDAGNFKPYFIGLYSGISFSF